MHIAILANNDKLAIELAKAGEPINVVDSEGFTPIDLANREEMYSLINELKNIQKAQDFQKLLKEQEDTEKREQDYLQTRAALHKALYDLSTNGPLGEIKNALWRKINAMDENNQYFALKFISHLLEQLQYPENLITESNEKLDKIKDKFFKSRATLKKIRDLIKLIDTIKKEIFDSKNNAAVSLISELNDLSNYYQTYVDNFQKAKEEQLLLTQSPVAMAGTHIAPRILKTEPANSLAKPILLGERDNEYGYHSVKAIGGIHFK